MATTFHTVTLARDTLEFDVTVEADVQRGGSNVYGSDEPMWVDVTDVRYYSPRTGEPVSERLAKWIDANRSDYIADEMAELEW